MGQDGLGRGRTSKDTGVDAQLCSREGGHALPLVPPSQERRAPQSHEAVCKGRMQGRAPGGPWARGGHPASRRPRHLQPTPRRGTGPAAAQPPRCGEPCVAGTSLFCFEGRPGITPSPPSKLPAWGGVPAHHRPQPPRRASGERLCLQAQARHLHLLPGKHQARGSLPLVPPLALQLQGLSVMNSHYPTPISQDTHPPQGRRSGPSHSAQ